MYIEHHVYTIHCIVIRGRCSHNYKVRRQGEDVGRWTSLQDGRAAPAYSHPDEEGLG